MSEQPATVSADEPGPWRDAVRRVEHGEVVAVIAHGEHVADVVPSGELDRLRETIEVLSDPDALRALNDTEVDLVGVDAIRQLVADRAQQSGS